MLNFILDLSSFYICPIRTNEKVTDFLLVHVIQNCILLINYCGGYLFVRHVLYTIHRTRLKGEVIPTSLFYQMLDKHYFNITDVWIVWSFNLLSIYWRVVVLCVFIDCPSLLHFWSHSAVNITYCDSYHQAFSSNIGPEWAFRRVSIGIQHLLSIKYFETEIENVPE